jgi:tetratricopeptide (TPR) repeat protein
MPLAIELAAGRTTLFSPEQIVDRLSSRLDLLKGGRDTDPRQQTLRATIEWSYDLLSDEEKRLFARLSVFAGGCTYEAAEEVAGADPDTLQSLLEKNLLRRRDSELGPRYWTLETIRDFARERLAASGELEDVSQRHADWVLRLARETEGLRVTAEQRRWRTTLEPEQDNLRAALAWMENRALIDAQLELVGSIFHFWYIRGSWREGQRWTEAALSRSAGERSVARAKALNAAAGYTEMLGDFASTRAYAEESLSISREAGDSREIAWALICLGIAASELDGDYEQAKTLFEEAANEAREVGDKWSLAVAVGDLGVAVSCQGDLARAIALTEEALVLFRELGSDAEVAWMLSNLAEGLAETGREEEALEAARESLVLSHAIGDVATRIASISMLASIAMRRGHAEPAAKLFGAADAFRVRIGKVIERSNVESHRTTSEALARRLGQERYEEAIAKGQSMSLDEAVRYALEALQGS